MTGHRSRSQFFRDDSITGNHALRLIGRTLRRSVRVDNQIFGATIKGISPLIPHNGSLADPDNPFSKELQKYIKGNAKDPVKAAHIEFLGSLYLDDSGEPCLPVDVIIAGLICGARAHKMGKQAQAGIYDLPSRPTFPLEYPGPRDPEHLYELPQFRDRRGVRVKQNRVIRTRPIFRSWSCSFEVEFDPTLISHEQISTSLARCGKAIGICDFRPRFGRFTVLP